MRIINKEVVDGNISGVKVSSMAPLISKLCYADDIILYCKAKASKLVSLKSCLEKSCSWSRQKISVEKFGFFPFQGCQPSVPQSSKVYLGLCSLLQHITYLGVPLFLSRSRGQDFRLVKEMLENKLSSWKGKNLSWSGWATFIKSVA